MKKLAFIASLWLCLAGTAQARDLCSLLSSAEYFASFGHAYRPDDAYIHALKRLDADEDIQQSIEHLAIALKDVQQTRSDRSIRQLRVVLRRLRIARPECFGLDEKEVADGSVVTPRPIASTAPAKPGSDQPESSDGEQSIQNLQISPSLAFLIGVLLVLAIWGGLYWSKRRRRAAKRFFCSVPVHVVTLTDEGDGIILDISQGGAQIKLIDISIAVGERVDIMSDMFETSGLVRWGNAHYIGVSFIKPLNSAKITSIRNI